jgi:hypothetical protein
VTGEDRSNLSCEINAGSWQSRFIDKVPPIPFRLCGHQERAADDDEAAKE